MAAAQCASIPAYAAHLADLHTHMPSARELTKMLQSLRSPNTRTVIQLPLHCKPCHSVPAQTCPVVVHQLPVLNEWLSTLASEIREVAPGKLALRSLKVGEVRKRLVADNQRVAVVLLHCLLTRHRCLQAAEGLHLLLPRYGKIFCDALRNSSSLTSLELAKCQLTRPMIQSLVAALKTTDILEELSLDRCRFPKSVRAAENALVSYIAKTKSLRTLSMVYVPQLFCDPKALLQSLEKNTSIVRLSLNSDILLPQQGETFRRFLAGSRTILDLELVNCSRCGSVRLDKLFMAITENSVLQKLSLRQFDLDLVTSVAFCDAVARCSTLQEVELPFCKLKPLQALGEPARERERLRIMAEVGEDFHVWPFICALQKTSSLRKLTLGVRFTDRELRKLLDAVGSCASLECLILDSFTPASLEAFSQALVETGTTKKVAFQSIDIPPSEFASALQNCGDTLRLGSYKFIQLSTQGLCEISAALVLHDHHVTSLQLVLGLTEIISREEASTIASYLSSTTALKDFLCMSYVSAEEAHILIEGISKNCTIEKLTIGEWFVSTEDIGVLCKWLADSKTVYHLFYRCFGSSEDYMALVSGLNEVLADGYSLTFLSFWEHQCAFNAIQSAKNLVRRNLSLVECAVQFVLGSTHKRAAEAFETVSYHPQVARKVGEAASLSPAEVKQKLKESWLRLRVHFWQLSGIVQGELVCNERRDGQMQIDKLGLDALLHLCSYLRISDVLD